MRNHFFLYRLVFLDLRPYHCRTKQIKTTNRYFPSIFDRFIFIYRSCKTYCIVLYPISFKEESGNYFEVPDISADQPRIKSDIDAETDFYKKVNKLMPFEIKVKKFTTGAAKDFLKAMSLLISSFYCSTVSTFLKQKVH